MTGERLQVIRITCEDLDWHPSPGEWLLTVSGLRKEIVDVAEVNSPIHPNKWRCWVRPYPRTHPVPPGVAVWQLTPHRR